MNTASCDGLLTFVLLGFIIAGLALFTVRWISRMQGLYSNGRHLRVIEATPLGKDRGLYLVAVGKQIMLVGSGPSGTQVLHVVDEAEAKQVLDAVEKERAEAAAATPDAIAERVQANLGKLRELLGTSYETVKRAVTAAASNQKQPDGVETVLPENAEGAPAEADGNQVQRPKTISEELKRLSNSGAGKLMVALLVAGLLTVGSGFAGLAPVAHAEPVELLQNLPTIEISVDSGGSEATEGLQVMQLFLLLTVLSLAPSILIMLTSFTRIVVVLSFTRQALGTQQLPPNAVLIGLALFLTIAVMSPTFSQVNEVAIRPYMAGQISQAEAIGRATGPFKDFMLKQTRESDLALMLDVMNAPKPEGPEDTPFLAVVPAFAISELKTAFTMGFVLFLPFMIIDLVVSSTLMSMGMMMLPPTMISLPFKIILFVLADGWHLIVQSLFESFM